MQHFEGNQFFKIEFSVEKQWIHHQEGSTGAPHNLQTCNQRWVVREAKRGYVCSGAITIQR